MLDLEIGVRILKIVTLASVFFVWFIRYDNIQEEFKRYGYSPKLRDLVGILKISCVLLLQLSNPLIVKIGSLVLAVLMSAALITHFRVKNKLIEAVPSFTLMCFGLLFFFAS